MTLSFRVFRPFLQYIISQALKTGLVESFFALLGWGGVALRCSPTKVSDLHYLDALNSAEKNQKKNRSADKITACTPLYHAKTLVGGFAAALCIYIRVQRLE